MKVAFSFFEDRIAPVFDTAERILVAETEGPSILTETIARLTAPQPLERAAALADMGVQVVVCGALSADLQRYLVSRGLQVIPFVAGDLRDIIQAWLDGRMEAGEYRMPGCRSARGGRRPGRGSRRVHRGRGPVGSEGVEGQASRRGTGHRHPGEACLCPACGHREPHEPGIPCHHRTCPTCGTAMTREFPLF